MAVIRITSKLTPAERKRLSRWRRRYEATERHLQVEPATRGGIFVHVLDAMGYLRDDTEAAHMVALAAMAAIQRRFNYRVTAQ